MSAIALIDYGAGNLRSVHNALVAAGAENVAVTADPDVVAQADRIVLPGVGAFADCMRGLDEISGMVAALNEATLKKGKPFFGICVGMQLLAERGLEHGVYNGLGWLKGEVDRITPSDPSLKIPHMGWNTLRVKRRHALFDGIDLGDRGEHAYFVHSYHFKPTDNADLVAEADYAGPITAMVARDNIAGSQFHPEKSQRLGQKLLANFLRWKP